MTLVSEIESTTSYNNTDVTNAVAEATNYCGMHNVTNDEIIKTAAIWLLERQTAERKARNDNAVAIPKIEELHRLIENLKGKDVDTTTKLVTSFDSPAQKGKSAFTW